MKFTIPVADYVRSYFLIEFGLEPIFLRADHQLARLIRLCLDECPEVLPAAVKSVENLTFELAGDGLPKLCLLPVKSKLLGEYLDCYFRDKMVTFLAGKISVSDNENKAINEFFRLYNFNPDTMDLNIIRKIWRDAKKNYLKGKKKGYLPVPEDFSYEIFLQDRI